MRSAQRLEPTSSTAGTGDAMDLLQEDHRRVETLFAKASMAGGDARRSAIDLILQELDQHAQLEETLVYPAIAKVLVGGEVLADRSVAEHDEMRSLMAVLARPGPEPTELEALARLQVVVQAHVAVEEGELFPAFRQHVSTEDLAGLTRATDEARGKAPPPGAPAALGKTAKRPSKSARRVTPTAKKATTKTTDKRPSKSRASSRRGQA
jgi:hypothetical protein